MPDSPRHDTVELRIEPPDGRVEVPVTVLTQTLLGFQELVQLFALQSEGRSLRQRLRLPEEIKNRYLLQCSPPQAGSFVVKARIGSDGNELFVPPRVEQVLDGLRRFTSAAVNGDRETLLNVAADSRLRLRMLDCLSKLAPPAGSGYIVSFQNSVGGPVRLGEDLPAKISGLLKRQEERPLIRTITGLLDEISFSEHKLTIVYEPRNRSLECFYEEDLEPMLFENRRDLIQVTGEAIMDDDGHPRKLVNVESIRELDLSPFNVTEIVGKSVSVKPRKALVLVPRLSDTQQFLYLENEALDLYVFAPTRGELLGELREQMLMLAEEYGLADADTLAPPARQLQQRLTQEWEMTRNG